MKVIVYAQCTWPSDPTGTRAVQMFIDKGYTDVVQMSGGFDAWEKAGYPITSNTITVEIYDMDFKQWK